MIPPLSVRSSVMPCLFFFFGVLINKSVMKTNAVSKHSAPKTAALSIKSSGTFSIDANDKAPTIPKRITPSPRKNISLNRKERSSYTHQAEQ